YEHVGLLEPATRTEGRQRLYDERDLRRLYRILALRDMGLSLAAIGRMLEGRKGSLGAVLRSHLARVEAELERLKRLRTLLEHACDHADQGIEPEEALATIEAMSAVA